MKALPEAGARRPAAPRFAGVGMMAEV